MKEHVFLGDSRKSSLQFPNNGKSNIEDMFLNMTLEKFISTINMTSFCPVSSGVLSSLSRKNNLDIKAAFVGLFARDTNKGDYQRDAFVSAIPHFALQPNIILVSDTDEIIRRESAEWLRKCPLSSSLVYFIMPYFIYNFNWITSRLWGLMFREGPYAAPWRLFEYNKKYTPSSFRKLLSVEYRELLLDIARFTDICIWNDQGWHLGAFKTALVAAKFRRLDIFDEFKDIWREEHMQLLQDLGIFYRGFMLTGENASEIISHSSAEYVNITTDFLPIAAKLDSVLRKRYVTEKLEITSSVIAAFDDLIYEFRNESDRKLSNSGSGVQFMWGVWGKTSSVDGAIKIVIQCHKNRTSDKDFIIKNYCCEDVHQCALATACLQHIDSIVDYADNCCLVSSRDEVIAQFKFIQ
jgi:hypothetical protein